MSNKQMILAILCIGIAAVLCWYSKSEWVAFLTLIGGSPLTPHQVQQPANIGGDLNVSASGGSEVKSNG